VRPTETLANSRSKDLYEKALLVADTCWFDVKGCDAGCMIETQRPLWRKTLLRLMEQELTTLSDDP